MSATYAKSPLARQAEKLLYEDDLDSSDSSMELHRSLSPSYRDRKKSSKKSKTITNESLNKTSNGLKRHNTSTYTRQDTAKTPRSERGTKRELSRSKTLDKSHLNASRIDEQLMKPTSCQQEKYLLRIQINDMRKNLEKQDVRVKNLHKRIMDKRSDIKDLTDELVQSKKKNLIVLELKEKVRGLESNEMTLVQELYEQQRVAKNALDKLYELQEEWTKEADRMRKHSKEQTNKKLAEQQNFWETKVHFLEEENWRLNGKIREIETLEEIERTRLNIQANSEIVSLKSQLNDKTIENDRLKGDIQDLQKTLSDVERNSGNEIKSLKNALEAANQQIRALKVHEDEVVNREYQEKNQARRKIEELQDELAQKERVMREKDAEYKEQLERITRKVVSLQSELRKLTEYEEKIDELGKSLSIKENELELTKKYYKEKLDSKKSLQDQQKREWTSIYNELLGEIKVLKGEIDALGGENKRLLNSVKSRY